MPSIGTANDTLPNGENAYDVANRYLAWKQSQDFEDKKTATITNVTEKVFEKIPA